MPNVRRTDGGEIIYGYDIDWNCGLSVRAGRDTLAGAVGEATFAVDVMDRHLLLGDFVFGADDGGKLNYAIETPGRTVHHPATAGL